MVVLVCADPALQAALLDSMYGTERGLAARSEIRAEINELITQLEAKNPTPSPTDVSRHGHTAKAPLLCTRLQLAIQFMQQIWYSTAGRVRSSRGG